MKNIIKLLTIIAFVTVVGFSMTACLEDGDDNFAGTWVNETKYEGDEWPTKIEANRGYFSMFFTFYFNNSGNEEYEKYRGAYEIDENTVTLTITEVISSTGEDEWIEVSELKLTEKEKENLTSEGTLSGDKFNFKFSKQQVPFTRQENAD